MPRPIGIEDGASLLWRWLQNAASLVDYLTSGDVVESVRTEQPDLSKQFRPFILLLERQGINSSMKAEGAVYPPEPVDNKRRWLEFEAGVAGASPFVRGWSLQSGGRDGFLGGMPTLRPLWMRHGVRVDDAAYKNALGR